MRAIRSALAQSWPAFEIIVVDDGSSDGTPVQLNHDFRAEIGSGRLKVLSRRHEGVSGARNSGLAAAGGEFIAFLDSDNIWHEDHLLFALSTLLTHPRARLAYTAVRVLNEASGHEKVLCQPYDRRSLLENNFIDLNAIVHEKSLAGEQGDFDTGLTRLVDWDYLIRLTKDLDPVGCPVVTVDYRLNENELKNITFTEDLDENALKIRNKYRAEHEKFGLSVGPRSSREGVPDAGPCPAPSLYVMLDVETALDGRLAEVLGEFDFGVGIVRREAGFDRFTVEAPDGSRLQTIEGARALPEGVYWCPDATQPIPGPDQIHALFMSLWINGLNFVCVSYSLARTPEIAASCIRNQCLLDKELVVPWLKGQSLADRVNGKMLHMPPGPGGAPLRAVRIGTLLGENVSHDPKSGALRSGARAQAVTRRFPLSAGTAYTKRKPTILAAAMKLAVGGVERNTIEVIRALRDEYDFLYLTMEPISEQNGSLADQAREVSHRLIDMCEITGHGRYLETLEQLRTIYQPDLLWFCNGSMWLCRNAGRIRALFADIPIVDQQVYDSNEGWIRHYHEPGIQSFDRFIAINSRVRGAFIDTFDMDPEKIDLIYHAIDGARFQAFKKTAIDRTGLRAKYGLPKDKKLFVCMGRLTEQKRPLDFLELSKHRSTQRDEHFLLVGNGALKDDVESWLAGNANENVQWIRHVNEVEELWSVTDGIVITSLYEGLPIAMLEALSMGVPVISTDVGDVRLVLERHKAGMIVDGFRDPARFAEIFSEWVGQLRVFRENLKTESDVVLNRFSASSISRQYADSWARAIAGRRDN